MQLTEPSSLRPSDSTGLPDVSIDLKPQFRSTLSRVGMRSIEMPIRAKIGGDELRLSSRIEALVSLDAPDAKGIHMSRLYLEVKEKLEKEFLSSQVLRDLTSKFLSSHEGLSLTSELAVAFELPLKRKALISETYGYRSYPIELRAVARKNESFRLEATVEILYSSTCPCSAALARELLREEFRRAFAHQPNPSRHEIEAWLASPEVALPTPHAQRSLARVKVCFGEGHFDSTLSSGLEYLPQLINSLEQAVGTPVQSAVKRVDEQEFARLNGENLMFCEDAARKIRSALETAAEIQDYDIYVEHQESLHPHNAVSRVVKGLPHGFRV
jgi:GTP cyclohydrolase I